MLLKGPWGPVGPLYQVWHHELCSLEALLALVAISDCSCWSFNIKGAKSQIRCDYAGLQAFDLFSMSPGPHVPEVSYTTVPLVGKVLL